MSGYEMHHNDLKYGEIVVDFCYIPKSFCYMKVKFFGKGGGGSGLILGHLFKSSKYGLI